MKFDNKDGKEIDNDSSIKDSNSREREKDKPNDSMPSKMKATKIIPR